MYTHPQIELVMLVGIYELIPGTSPVNQKVPQMSCEKIGWPYRSYPGF